MALNISVIRRLQKLRIKPEHIKNVNSIECFQTTERGLIK